MKITTTVLMLSFQLFICSNSICYSDSDDDVNATYKRAVQDASVAEQSEVSDHLTPITTSKATLVAWINSRYCGNEFWEKVKSGLDLDCEQSELWVTVSPELQQFCSKLLGNAQSKTDRLEKLLGLPPGYGLTHFLTIEVPSSIVIRPCPDTDPSDTSCGFEFQSNNVPIEQYEAWFARNSIIAYSIHQKNIGFAWTRLGYTYDWGKDAPHFGLSEYILLRQPQTKGIPIHVVTAPQDVDKFCK